MAGMVRRIAAVGAVALALGFGGAAVAQTAPAVPSSGTANVAVAIMQATAAMQAGKCDEALPFLSQLWDSAELQAADPVTAEQFRFQRILCTLKQSGVAAAVTMSGDNIHHAGATILSYDLHTFLLLSSQQVPAAAAALDEAMTRFPDTAPNLTDISVMATLLTLPDDASRNSLLTHLEKVRWQIHDASGRMILDVLRLYGLRAAVKSNDTELAALYRNDIASDAYIYALSQGDGTLSDAAVPPAYLVPVAKQQIEDVKTHITQRPTDLLGLEYLIGLERSTDDNDIALVQLNGIFNLIRINGLQKFDQPNAYPALMALKARLLLDLNRPGDAIDVYKDGADHMKGPGTIDFTLDYMDYLIAAGREQDALALESHIDFVSMSTGQKRQLAATEACAYAYLKDTTRYSLSLAASADAKGMPAIKPYLCAGDTEGAAAALVAHVNDGDSRDEVIMMLQDSKPQIARTPRDHDYLNALANLKKRPDVVAAATTQKIIVRTWPLRF